MSIPYRNPVIHDTRNSEFLGTFELTETALKNYGIVRDKFGSTEILLAGGKSFTVKDYQYQLEDGQVGMYFIPVNDHGSILDKDGQYVDGNALIDTFLREKMQLKENEPIYAFLNYFHPEQNKGTIRDLATKTDKVEMGFTHLGAYYGEGYTTNAPMLYHGHKFGVDGTANQTVFGYPANVQIISLDGVAQGTLNKNFRYVDTCLNSGVMFPKDYKDSKFRPIDINTALMFYRDWIKFEGYLREDDSWYTYCAAHKTLVSTIALNLPHNLNSFQEVYGIDEGEDLYNRFIKFYSNIIGPCPGFTKEDETYFEPLWKKQGYSQKQISPFTLQEYNDYDKARRERRLPVFFGKKPLKPNEATPWAPQSSADIIYDFVQIYGDMLDAGPIVSSTLILGFMDIVDERMGINKLQYLLHAMPIVDKLMIAHASMYATKDPDNYLKKTYHELYLAFGGKPESKVDFEEEIKKLKSFRDLENSLEEFVKSNPVPAAIAAWALLGVVLHWNDIIKGGAVLPEDAYVTMMESIQPDLKKAEEMLVTDPDKVQFNTPPAIVHLISNGMYTANSLISVKEVCTAIDVSEAQLKSK